MPGAGFDECSNLRSHILELADSCHDQRLLLMNLDGDGTTPLRQRALTIGQFGRELRLRIEDQFSREKAGTGGDVEVIRLPSGLLGSPPPDRRTLDVLLQRLTDLERALDALEARVRAEGTWKCTRSTLKQLSRAFAQDHDTEWLAGRVEGHGGEQLLYKGLLTEPASRATPAAWAWQHPWIDWETLPEPTQHDMDEQKRRYMLWD